MKNLLKFGLGAALSVAAFAAIPAQASAQDQVMSSIRILPYTRGCPLDYTPLNGQMMAVVDNQALFSLLGCTYGGDCRTTFAPPDARGRVLVGNGSLPGGDTYNLGQSFGAETVSQVPQHTHAAVLGSAQDGNSTDPDNNVVATVTVAKVYKSESATSVGAMAAGTIGMPAGSVPSVPNTQPSTVLNFCLVTDGIYPQRN